MRHHRRDQVLLARNVLRGVDAVDIDIRHQSRLADAGFHQRGADEVAILAHAAADPVAEEEPAVLVGMGDVAGAEPAIAHLLGAGVRILQVVDGDGRTVGPAEAKLAGLVRLAALARLVEAGRLRARHRPAHAADRAFAGKVDQRTAAFGRTVDLADPHAEAALVFGPQVVRHAGADDEAQRVVGILGRFRRGVDFRDHAAEQVEDRAVVAADDVPEPALGELAADDGRQRAAKRAPQRGLRVDMGQRQAGIEHVVVPDAERRAVIGRRHVLAERQHHRLGIAGGAGGEHHHHRIGRRGGRDRRPVAPRGDRVAIGDLAKAAGSVRRCVIAGHHQPLQAADRGAEPADRRRAIGGADRALAFGVLQHVAQLVADHARIDRHEGGAEPRRRQHGFDEFRMVRHHDREGLAGPDAERLQLRGQGAGMGMKLREGSCLVLQRAGRTDIDECQHAEVGVLAGLAGHQRGEIGVGSSLHCVDGLGSMNGRRMSPKKQAMRKPETAGAAGRMEA